MNETFARAHEALDLAYQIADREGLGGEDREKFVRLLSHRIGVPPLPGISLTRYFLGMIVGAGAALTVLAARREQPFTRESLLVALIVGICGGMAATLLHSRRALKRFHAPLPSLDTYWPIYLRDHRPGLELELPGLLAKTPPGAD